MKLPGAPSAVKGRVRRFPTFSLELPDWLMRFPADAEQVYPTDEDRMRLVIELARTNAREGTGGPFGAGVFDTRTHTLVAPGVNLVISANCSLLHAEMVAILIAQQIAGTYDLGGPAMPPSGTGRQHRSLRYVPGGDSLVGGPGAGLRRTRRRRARHRVRRGGQAGRTGSRRWKTGVSASGKTSAAMKPWRFCVTTLKAGDSSIMPAGARR